MSPLAKDGQAQSTNGYCSTVSIGLARLIEMNADVMARYRPAMRAVYYGETRYATYLDQLGVKWPTLQRTD